MAAPAPAEQDVPGRYTVAQYFDLVRQGVLQPDDRVELLDGVIVAMSPHNPWHETAVQRAFIALLGAVQGRAAVRCQVSLLLGPRSSPEPDVAVVPGTIDDYVTRHPTAALLVVECADTSLPQDRLSKSRIYAAAGIPAYWIVSRRDDAVEVFWNPERATATYQNRRLAGRGERLT
ncbi:MAG: Uma2 family endonuclease, partial [Candidatus Binatia bacterium]